MSSTVHPMPYGGPAPTYPTGAPAQPGYPPPGYYPPPQQPGYPAAGPPQPAYYPQYNQQAYATPASGAVVVQPSTIVISAILPKFRQSPVSIICPHCHNNVQTKIYYKIGGFTWLVALVIFFFFPFGCCLIPFCINSCKDVEHICPSCNRMVGKFHRL